MLKNSLNRKSYVNLACYLTLVIFFWIIMLPIIHAEDNLITVQGDTFSDKMAWLNVFGQSNTNYILEINSDERITSQSFVYSGKTNINITIKGIGGSRNIRLSEPRDRITVGSGITLVFDDNVNVIGRGSLPNSAGNGGVVYVETGGTFIMNEGSNISQGNIEGYGHGVYVHGGSFIMNGGQIYGKRGYGVFLRDGSFTMDSGIIRGNSSGGVTSQFGNPSFTMNGGSILNNNGAGVHLRAGAFVMNAGEISNNSNTTRSTTPTHGGGVIVINNNVRFTMHGGTISGNTANFGGGVSISHGGEFILNDGYIFGNNAVITVHGVVRPFGGSGGGVHGGFQMNGGNITGNIAHRVGGGVFVEGRVNMLNGTISSNTSRENGGGVYVNSGTFTKTGGILTGFTDNSSDGNVVKDSSGNVLNFRGHAAYAGSADTVLKIKEKSAGQEENLFFNTSGNQFNGEWDN
ncbi:MAG: hypothetical protein FWG98_08735 [Candidatus Cloacimonetes bacterium]|nr:hypothetical protein [Candidatus Cloacimonadota bacterium]